MGAAARPLPALLVCSLLAYSAWGLRTAVERKQPESNLSQATPTATPTVQARSRTCRLPLEPCKFADMPRHETTMVYPGGKTRCIASVMPYFAFGVIPRDQDKLLIMFQGGGACWDAMSTRLRLCTVFRSREPELIGHLDPGADGNPFANHTLVYITACSGDLHAGNVTQMYNDTRGVPIEQRGYYNTRATIDWIKANMQMQQLSSLVIAGESAGSIGVQVWAHQMLSELRYKEASVIADSYVGAFPEGFSGPVFKSLGVCQTGLFDAQAGLREKCNSGNMTLPDVFEAAMADFPMVSFGTVASKYDITQMEYYKLSALSMGKPEAMGPDRFKHMVNAIVGRYRKYPNHGYFLLSSPWHTITLQAYHDYGNSTSVAFTGGFQGRVRHRFEEWMAHLAAHDLSFGSYCEMTTPSVLEGKGLGSELLDACDLEPAGEQALSDSVS